ncbi:MAG: hypothetical protein M1309_06930 [Actinobacteria bacterium]|nr:hypothetical protein [Actinomycetota bacterium]
MKKITVTGIVATGLILMLAVVAGGCVTQTKTQVSKTDQVKSAENRWVHDYESGNVDDLYSMLDPDSQKSVSKANFALSVQRNRGYKMNGTTEERLPNTGTITDYQIGKISFLKSWTNVLNGKTYSDVATVEETLNLQAPGMTETQRDTAHWVNLNGKWTRFYPEATHIEGSDFPDGHPH